MDLGALGVWQPEVCKWISFLAQCAWVPPTIEYSILW